LSARKTKQPRQAIGYIRVSTTDQANHGVSLEAQENRVRDWCATNGYVLGEVFVDRGLSGCRADNRPALKEALAATRRGDALVVYSLSRLARSTRDTLEIAETLDRRGADLVSLSEKIDTTSAAGRMIFRLLAVLAEFERDVISERTSMAMRHLQRQGRYIGGHPGWGYAREGDFLAALPYEQATVKLAVALRSEGMSLRKVSQALAARGIYNRAGKPIAAIQIHRMADSVSLARHPMHSPLGGNVHVG
jgi:DNA invertase Pin-like site-specific DNA recombinase